MGSQAAAVTGDWPAGRYVAAVLPPGTQVPLFFAFAITSQPAP
jgi:hypothetical protein